MSSTSVDVSSLGNTVPAASVAAAIDPASITKAIDLVLNMAGTVAKFTGTDADDKVVAVLKTLSHESWFAELLTTMVTLFGQGQQEEAMQMARSTVASMSGPVDAQA